MKSLLPVVMSPDSTVNKLVAATKKLESLQTTVDATLVRVLSRSNQAEGHLREIEQANATLLSRISGDVTRSKHAIKLTNGFKSSLRQLLDSQGSTAIPLIEATQAREYYRKLAKKHHPDKGGKPENFSLVHQAYLAGNFALLYLFLLSDPNEIPDDEALLRALSATCRRLDDLLSGNSYLVAKTFLAGKPADAVVHLERLLARKLRELKGLLSGYVPTPTNN